MHELSIALSIVEIVEEHARGMESPVSEVELEIGSMSGVVIEALQFALEEAVKGSAMEQAAIKITEVQAIMKCESCGHEFTPTDVIEPCPECGYPYSDVIRGMEMKVKRIVF